MPITWIAVAHRGGASVFESRSPNLPLKLVEKLEHPAGRLKASEINTDRPGASSESGGSGQHPMRRRQSATDVIADQFAREVAALLDAGRTGDRFRRLALVAEPRFLGRLREAMTPATRALVMVSVDKNLPRADAASVRELLAHEILV